MSRSLVYVNSNAETLTIGSSGPIVIIKVEGLGTPETMVQEQKAPFQDGTTYIDALFQPREIIVELAINAPNDFASIDTYRRELSRKLNPKLGQGTLTYTTENGAQYKIAAIPVTAPQFPNKDYRDPYARAMVTFHCCDPYWMALTPLTVSLPTPTITSATVVSAASTFPSAILKTSGDIVMAYIRSADNYLVSRTYSASTGTWGSESVINGATSIYSALAEKSTGTIIAMYQRLSDNYLVYREYSSGTWGAETVINAANSLYPSVIFDSQERVSAAYIRNADKYFVWKNWGILNGTASVINAASTAASSIIQKQDGNLLIAYKRNSDGYLVSREYTTSWQAESVIAAAVINMVSLVQRSNGNLVVVYTLASNNYLYTREYTGSWSAATNIYNGFSLYPSVIEKTGGNLAVAFYSTVSSSIYYSEYSTSWSTPTAIFTSGGGGCSLVERANGNLAIAYQRTSGSYLAYREYTTSWGSEQIINNASSGDCSLVSKIDGTMIVAYRRASDNYLVYRTFTTEWSSEVVINSALTDSITMTQKTDQNLIVAYRRSSDSYLVMREDILVESTISGSATLSGQVIKSGSNYLAVYARTSDGYIVSRTYTTGWSTETVIVSAASTKPSVAYDTRGRLVLVYINASNQLMATTYTTSWSTPTTLVASAVDNCYLIAKPGNALFVAYQRGADDYILELNIGIANPTTATITGDYKTPLQVSFNGPSTNPRVIKSETGEYIKLNTTLATGDNFVVDTTFGNKTVTLTQNGVVKNGIAYLDIGSTFFQLDQGDNIVYFEDDATASTATATMTWTERYVGV